MHKNVERDMKAAKDALDHARTNQLSHEDELNFDLASAIAFALLSVAGAVGHLEDALTKEEDDSEDKV